MQKPRSSTLKLLALEDRLTPAASVMFSGGHLTVTANNTPTSIFITNSDTNTKGAIAGAPGSWRVFVVDGNQRAALVLSGGDPAQFETAKFSRGNYQVTGNITANGGNSDDVVFVTIQDGTTMPGNFGSSLGNGSDDVQLQTRTNGQATIAGGLTVNGGLGADNMVLFDNRVQGLANFTGGGSGFRTDTKLPGDVIVMSNSATAQLMLVNNCVALIDSGFGPNQIGSLVVNDNIPAPLGNFQYLDGTAFGTMKAGTYSGLVAIDSGSSVAGNVTFVGSSSNDGFYLGGTVGGQVNVVPNAGTNDMFLTSLPLAPGAEPGTVNGGLQYTAFGGVDQVSFPTGASVFGNATLYMGDGNNLYDLDNDFLVGGAFQVTAGNGIDNVGSVNGQINGNQYFSMGNGANTVFSNPGFSSSARFDYQGGGGTDILIINGTNTFALRAYLGAGADIFIYGAGASVASAYLDFGVDFDLDTYDDSLTTVTWPQTIVNFP